MLVGTYRNSARGSGSRTDLVAEWISSPERMRDDTRAGGQRVPQRKGWKHRILSKHIHEHHGSQTEIPDGRGYGLHEAAVEVFPPCLSVRR